MRALRLASFCALVFTGFHLWAADAASPQTLRYTIVSNGKTAGTEVDIYGPGGQIDSTFEFNDRGRGPKIEAHYIVAADGSPLRVDITGNDYLKAPVDEHFAMKPALAIGRALPRTDRLPRRGSTSASTGRPPSRPCSWGPVKGEGCSCQIVPRRRGQTGTNDGSDR